MRTPRNPNSVRSDGDGWGHTAGWSKKLHLFEEGRAHCSGSPSRAGEDLTEQPPANPAAGESVCTDCLKYATAIANDGGERSRRIRGIPRVEGSHRTPRFYKGTAKLYRETNAYA